ncbi:hypothetical protein ACKAV7_001829 [Fusarium commune]
MSAEKWHKDESDHGPNLEPAMTSDEGTVTAEGGQLRREFKARHVSMIAVAGAIGTGLIIGTGTALVRGGPANLLIAYCLVGAVVFFVMTALGEMSIMFPMDKGFGGYATRFVDPALGYATGWNYFFKYAIVLPNNLTAAGIIIQYWRPDLNVAIFVTVFTVVIILVNLLHVSFFGEAEFWMSCVKLLVMTTLILTCFVISVGGQPSGKKIGFSYWNYPGAFGEYLLKGPKGHLLGFWAAIVQSTFAYTGTEVVGVAFGEAPDPKKTIRNAIRQTLWRIVFFYIIGALNWVNILVTYIGFTRGLKAQGIERSSMPYRGIFQPYGAYFALSLTILIIIFNGYGAFIPTFDVAKLLTSYIGVVVYLGNVIFWKAWRRTERVSLTEIDLTTGRLTDY